MFVFESAVLFAWYLFFCRCLPSQSHSFSSLPHYFLIAHRMFVFSSHCHVSHLLWWHIRVLFSRFSPSLWQSDRLTWCCSSSSGGGDICLFIYTSVFFVHFTFFLENWLLFLFGIHRSNTIAFFFCSVIGPALNQRTSIASAVSGTCVAVAGWPCSMVVQLPCRCLSLWSFFFL